MVIVQSYILATITMVGDGMKEKRGEQEEERKEGQTQVRRKEKGYWALCAMQMISDYNIFFVCTPICNFI